MIRRDAKTKKDYLLLRNYNDNIRSMRGLSFTVAIESINHAEEGKFLRGNISSIEDRVKVKKAFQLEIISSIMLYIEDLVVLSEAFRRGISYYELLRLSDTGEIDLGKMIEKFFEDVGCYSDEELCKIFGYADPSRLDLEEDERELVEKVMQENIVEMKKAFAKIETFGKTHHPVFKRFKHGGAPLLFDPKVTVRGDFPLSESESFITVSTGEDPCEDVIFIPLSKDVLTGYEIVVRGIQYCLLDMVTNHIACIERNLPGIPPHEHYSRDSLSTKETDLYAKILEKFVAKYPAHMDGLLDFSFDVTVTKKQFKWYHDLPNLLRESEKIREAAGKPS